jgi:hypothetical protein
MGDMSDWQIILAVFSAVLSILIFVFGLGWKIREWLGRIEMLEAQTPDLRRDINNLRKDIDKRLDEIVAIISGGKSVEQTTSPIQLTDYGTEISKQLGFQDVINEVLHDVEIEQGMNEYQIQQLCFDYAQSEFMERISPDNREKIEKVAFEEGMPIQTVLRVVGIELRNAKFNQLGINRDAIDHHASDKNTE